MKIIGTIFCLIVVAGCMSTGRLTYYCNIDDGLPGLDEPSPEWIIRDQGGPIPKPGDTFLIVYSNDKGNVGTERWKVTGHSISSAVFQLVESAPGTLFHGAEQFSTIPFTAARCASANVW